MTTPLVSIIVPCYNQAIYLSEALQSVSDQKFKNWECIIINDGSTDATSDIAKGFLVQDHRFHYIKQKNLGVSNARNKGIAVSRGEFILPLDADDKISEEYLEEAVNAFAKNPKLVLVYCQAEKFGEENGRWILPPFCRSKLAEENIIFSSAFYRKTDWKRIGGYDEKMHLGLEDWEFWISLLKEGGEVKKINKICFFYRINNFSRNQKLDKNNYSELENYVSIKHADFFVKELGSFMSLNRTARIIKDDYLRKSKSEKYIINLLTERFFGFSIFKNEIG